MIPCCCPLFAVIQAVDVALLLIVTISAGFVVYSLSPSATSAYISQLGSGILALLSLALTVIAIGMRLVGRDVGRTITWGLGGCALGCGAAWLWLCVNKREDLICTGYSFMSSACSWSGMKYFLYAIFIISVISQILFFFIVKLGDIPCLNFAGRGKSRSIGKRSSRGERDDSEGEMRGLRGDWHSGSEEGSDLNGDERKERRMSGRGRMGEGDSEGVGHNAGLSDEEMMGGGANSVPRASPSVGRY